MRCRCAARGGLLLNLERKRAVLRAGATAAMLHDAAVFDRPEAYSAAVRRLVPAACSRALAGERSGSSPCRRSRATRLALRLGVPESRFHVLPNAADHLDAVVADDTVLDRHGLRGRRVPARGRQREPDQEPRRPWSQAFGSPDGPDLRLVIVGGSERPGVRRRRRRGADPPGVIRTGPLERRALEGACIATRWRSCFPRSTKASGCRRWRRWPRAARSARRTRPSLPEVCGDAALYFDPGCRSRRSQRPSSGSSTDADLRDRPAASRARVRRRSIPGQPRPSSCARLSAESGRGSEGAAAQQVLPAGDGRHRVGGLGADRRAASRRRRVPGAVLEPGGRSRCASARPRATTCCGSAPGAGCCRPRWRPRMPLHLRRLARVARHRPRAHARPDGGARAAGRADRRRRVVVHWHSDVIRQRRTLKLYEPLQRWLLRRADAIVATSPPYAESSAVLAPLAQQGQGDPDRHQRQSRLGLQRASSGAAPALRPAADRVRARPHDVLQGLRRAHRGGGGAARRLRRADRRRRRAAGTLPFDGGRPRAGRQGASAGTRQGPRAARATSRPATSSACPRPCAPRPTAWRCSRR